MSQRTLSDRLYAIFTAAALDIAHQAVSLLSQFGKAKKKSDIIVEQIDFSSLDPIATQAQKELNDVAKQAGQYTFLQLSINDQGLVGTVNEFAASYARDRAAEMIGRKWVDGELVDNPNAEWVITDAIRDEIKGLINDVENGDLDVTDLRREIIDAAGFSRARAEMISRTEIMTANGQGSLESFKALDGDGLKVRKSWDADSEACEICQGNAKAGAIDLDDDFPSGDDAPPGHVNCECILVPEIEYTDED